MHTLISFTMLCAIKVFAKIFYKFEINWLSDQRDFEKVRLVAILNHTSLYEPLMFATAPNWFLWKIARKMALPVADKTMKRPIVGRFFRFLIPGIISITRKRDQSWRHFLKAIENRSVIIILPEGRMKRHNGLDAYGRPMDVKAGITDIIPKLQEGNILFAYSGGLHHIQHPGEFFPRLFKTIKLNLELVDIESYKSQFKTDGIALKREIVADMNQRLAEKCPK